MYRIKAYIKDVKQEIKDSWSLGLLVGMLALMSLTSTIYMICTKDVSSETLLGVIIPVMTMISVLNISVNTSRKYK